MWWPFSRKYPERSPEDVNEREYDYIVVGGKSTCSRSPIGVAHEISAHTSFW